MRAVFAVFGFVAFYVVLIGAIIGLAWAGIVMFGWLPEAHHVKLMLLLGLVAGACVLAAGVLAWSALPRIDRFEPPGPELTEEAHPDLFAMIRQVANATGQRMPVHVYAVLEVNAFVAERGGIMGIGSRRVMGIGLGLLNAFSVDEVRAVVAHELGHFHGGDTRLGPWVYKTRAAMGRTVVNLRRAAAQATDLEAVNAVFRIIEAPFRWMALGYMRLASAVSRAQEYSADAVAARVVGTQPVLSGFGKLAGTSAGVEAYFESEISTLVRHGVLAPVLDGARQFVEANRAQLSEIDANTAKLGEVSPFDSHPPLPERIAAIQRLAPSLQPLVGTADQRPGIALLRDPEELVRGLITERAGKPLRSVEWTEVAPLFMREQHENVWHHRRWLASRRIADLDLSPDTARQIAKDIEGLGDHVHRLSPDTLTQIMSAVYTAALAVALEHAGYEPRTGPGEPLRFHRADTVIEPRAIVRRYIARDLSADAWVATWEGFGLPERPWADVSWKSAPSSSVP